MALDLASLGKATRSMEKLVERVGEPGFINGLDDVARDGIRAGVIQNFEFVYELCWKFMKRWLEVNVGHVYVDGVSRKELFRMAAEHRLIDDVEQWWSFHKARNLTSHIYDENVASEVFDTSVEFVGAASAFLSAIEKRND